MTYKLDKEDNSDLAKSIQDLYISTRKFNVLGGNEKLCKERIPTQIELVKAECNELFKALEDNDLVELVDGVGDVLVTASELICLLDGDTYLLNNPPKYLNSGHCNVTQLVKELELHVENDNWIDVLGTAEDLAAQVNADMSHNLNSISESNLSKFITTKELDESAYSEFSLIEDIEKQGRYTDVYSETIDFENEEYIVFKSKYDQLNNEKYPKGKILKPPYFFKEPELVIYE